MVYICCLVAEKVWGRKIKHYLFPIKKDLWSLKKSRFSVFLMVKWINRKTIYFLQHYHGLPKEIGGPGCHLIAVIFICWNKNHRNHCVAPILTFKGCGIPCLPSNSVLHGGTLTSTMTTLSYGEAHQLVYKFLPYCDAKMSFA